jgi:hypothetical protein
MEVTIRATPWKGSEAAPPETAPAALLVRGVVVDGEEIEFEPDSHRMVCAVEWPVGGFLSVTLRGVSEAGYNRFMEGRSPDDVLEGTGTKIVEGDEVVGLTWMKNDELILLVTQLDVQFVDE